jgi:hypothetical protein
MTDRERDESDEDDERLSKEVFRPVYKAFGAEFNRDAEARLELLAAIQEYVADAGIFDPMVTTKRALQPDTGDKDDGRYTEAWRFLQKYLMVHMMPHVTQGYDVSETEPVDTQGARELVVVEPGMVEFWDHEPMEGLDFPPRSDRVARLLEYLITYWDTPPVEDEVLRVDPKSAALYAVAAPYAEFDTESDTPAVTFGIESAPSSDLEDGPENDYRYERTIRIDGELTGVCEVTDERGLRVDLGGQLWMFLLGACYDKQAWTRAVEYPTNSPGAINMSSGEFVPDVEWYEDAGTVRFEASFNLASQLLSTRDDAP